MGQLHGMRQEVKRRPLQSTVCVYTQLFDETLYKFVMDKQRFIIPPVYDKSTLLSHESIRSLWHQAKHLALGPVDSLLHHRLLLTELIFLCAPFSGKVPNNLVIPNLARN